MVSFVCNADLPLGVDQSLPEEDIFGNVKKLRFILKEIADHKARIGREIRLLDFGCGNATALGQYLIGDGIRYVGVDFHEPSLGYAREHFGGADASFAAAVPDNIEFDVLVYAAVLEHVHDPLAVLTAHVRQLAPDGIVIGSVPNGYGPCETEKFVNRHLHLYRALRFIKRSTLSLLGRPPLVRETLPYNSASGHVVFFTLKSFRRMVADSGLRIFRFGHGGFVGADVTGSTIFRSRRFVSWNVNVSDRLPSWAVSTWYFVLARGACTPGTWSQATGSCAAL
jgi:2-polyprenyl-3-methyl-5-hydroxy-6-metoxy-1,4-benzoquinol methylase